MIMHGIHRRRRFRRFTWLLAALLRMLRPTTGMHNAPRGGDLFPTGPAPVQEGVFYREVYGWMALDPSVPPRGVHPYPDITVVDLPAVSGRPYLNPVLTGGER